ncbi:glycine cleavage system protein GcvH [Jatrophihabitans lederbergiae]|uniref:Glycine cleavage system H protein n=1 Tax=Jatrophihabitans lederbergiae TaxID=3075547 RepID=A0ABU2JDD8_9ACTN|nr:glycine cleavage system protein GcvH [Jatrophihabitans sp. DSM 44399]MDT0262791.1 glycine cleavage system protein GcvH [Jatrophihabitans sp. DSM 44399]
MAEIPADLRYTTEHEWAKITGGNTVRIGITDYAQNSLGDIVFVSVHGLDTEVASGDTLGEVESTKSVSDLYAPLAGSVVARNEALDDTPELVNSDPYGSGWIAEIEVEDLSVLDSLLDAEAYRTATAE